MAGDLRIIVAILNIVVELERIGDYAEGIGKIALRLLEEPELKPDIGWRTYPTGSSASLCSPSWPGMPVWPGR